MPRILHVTAHLGGGVGRVLSQVVKYSARHNINAIHDFVCLEAPEKTQFVDVVRKSGSIVTVARNYAQTKALLKNADIVQLEWWHHPLMAEWLYDASGISCRLAVWSHTSGLHYPAFPTGFTLLSHAFMATTAASGTLSVVSSSGGFEGDAPAVRAPAEKLRYGYIGSLNPAKLHPRIMDFLAAAGDDFSAVFYGDMEVGSPLTANKHAQLMGYTEHPAMMLRQMDVFVYLLNPLHYGTTENALLEAMAAGVVPIVMNNAVEASIVKHGKTGMVVDSPAAFAKAIHYLKTNPAERARMATAAASDVRQRFSLVATVNGLTQNYLQIMKLKPKTFNFRAVLGDTPFEWFFAGLGRYAPLFADGAEETKRKERCQLSFLYEKNKSSLFHFLRYFPDDTKLVHWARVLEEDRTQGQAYGT